MKENNKHGLNDPRVHTPDWSTVQENSTVKEYRQEEPTVCSKISSFMPLVFGPDHLQDDTVQNKCQQEEPTTKEMPAGSNVKDLLLYILQRPVWLTDLEKYSNNTEFKKYVSSLGPNIPTFSDITEEFHNNSKSNESESEPLSINVHEIDLSKARETVNNYKHWAEGLGIPLNELWTNEYDIASKYANHINTVIWDCSIPFEDMFYCNKEVYVDLAYKGSKHDDGFSGITIYVPVEGAYNTTRHFHQITYLITEKDNVETRGFVVDGSITFGNAWDLDKEMIHMPAKHALDLLIYNADLLYTRSKIDSTLLTQWKKLREQGKDSDDLMRNYIRNIDRGFIK